MIAGSTKDVRSAYGNISDVKKALSAARASSEEFDLLWKVRSTLLMLIIPQYTFCLVRDLKRKLAWMLVAYYYKG